MISINRIYKKEDIPLKDLKKVLKGFGIKFDINKSFKQMCDCELESIEILMELEKQLEMDITDDTWEDLTQSNSLSFLLKAERDKKIKLLGI